MGYVDRQIKASQKKLGDAVSGRNLQKAIKALQERTKVRNSLEDLPTRGSIIAKRKLALRSGSAIANFIEARRDFYEEVREIESSDGLFVLQYKNVRQIYMVDGTVFAYADYIPS